MKYFFILITLSASQMGIAAIISVSGNAIFQGSADGVDFSQGQFVGSENALFQGFNERQLIASGPISIDRLITAADIGAGPQFGTDDPMIDGEMALLPAGTYSSHMILWDPIGNFSGQSIQTNGIFDFDGDIVGVITSTAYLDLSDGLGGVLTTYPTGENGRRSENDEQFQINSSTQLQILFATTAQNFHDEFRVITLAPAAPVPEPGTLITFAAILGLLGLRWRHHITAGPRKTP